MKMKLGNDTRLSDFEVISRVISQSEYGGTELKDRVEKVDKKSYSISKC
jgi:hypothetical protein